MKAGVVIGHLNNRMNEGAILRTAEAFGVNLILVEGIKRIYSSSQGAENHLIFLEFKNSDKLIGYCKMNNHSIVCIENVEGATPINEVMDYPNNPIFVTGNEGRGVPEDYIKNASLIVKIPQANTYMKCLNTTIACSIIINDWFIKNNKKRSEHNRWKGD